MVSSNFSVKLKAGIAILGGSMVLLAMLYTAPCLAQNAHTAHKQTTPDTRAAQKTGGQPAFVECSGSFRSRQRFFLFLQPGERVLEVFFKRGQRVKKGDPVTRLSNEGLYEQYYILKEKELFALKEQNRADILKLRMQIRQEGLKRLNGKIAKEREILKKVPEYHIKEKISQLEEEKKDREGELQILQGERQAILKWLKKNSELTKVRSAKLSNINFQKEGWLVKAPFGGYVVRAAQFPVRLRSGELVLEIVDDQHLEVVAFAWQNQMKHISPGLKAKVYPNFFDDTFLYGTVRSVVPVARIESNREIPSFPVIIDLDDDNIKFYPGMTVTVRILTPK